MGAGWKLTDSNGDEYGAWHRAVEAFRVDPTLTFEESWLEMAGVQTRDATDEVRRRAGGTPT